MFPILDKRQLADGIFELTVDAPAVAKAAKAGQFLIVRTTAKGERVPLTFSDWDAEQGWVRFIFMTVGKTTREMASLEKGDVLHDLVGPLGNPTELTGDRWVVVGGGVGTSVAYPVARALCESGAEVSVIVGSRNKELLILENELRALSLKELHVMTDDGSAGQKGLVTHPLKEMCEQGGIDHVFIVGPAIMMKFASLTTKEFDVPTIVSLNPIMVDGTGMCGACRCSVHGELKFGCVDGPDFDGHGVDWEELMNRQRMYTGEEQAADAAYIQECSCQNK